MAQLAWALRPAGTDRQTDGWIAVSLNAPYGGGTCANIVAVMTPGFGLGLGLGLAGQVLAMALADVIKLRYINSNI